MSKRKTFAGLILGAITLGGIHHESISNQFTNTYGHIVTGETSVYQKQERMESLKSRFFWYQFTKDNVEIFQGYKQLTSYDFGNLSKKKAKEFIKFAPEFLKMIRTIQWKYKEDKQAYNAIEQDIIKHTKEYITIGLELVEQNHPNIVNFGKVKRETYSN